MGTGTVNGLPPLPPGFQLERPSPGQSSPGQTNLPPFPPGFVLEQDQPAPAQPQFSAGETAALGLTNLFGAGDAIGAFVNSRLRGGSYEDWRQKFAEAREAANEQNPIAHYAGAAGALGLETVLGGAAGKVVEGVGEATGLASKFLPWAEAHPILSKVLQGAGAGAAYGAAGGAGTALSEGKDLAGTAEAALSGAGTGALLGGAAGGVAGTASRLFKALPEAADKAIIGDLTSGADKATRAAVRESKEVILDAVRSDPELMRAVTGKAEEAIPIIEQKADQLAKAIPTASPSEAISMREQFKALTAIGQSLADKADKAAEQAPDTFGKLLKGGGAVAAVPMLLHGNVPGAAAALVTPHLLPLVGKAQRGATEALATLARSAESGNPRALRLLKTIQAGQKVGLAGTGTAVGSVKASTLAQGQP